MWYTLALLSSVFYSFRGILEKRIIHNVNKYVLGLGIRLFALPFFFIPLFINPHLGQPLMHLNTSFWFAIFMICFVNTPLETYFYYEALKKDELTLVLPILALGPVITLLSGAIFLKEIPSLFGIFGVLCIVLGLYTLKLQHAKNGLLEPLHHLRNNRGVQLMFVVMISQGIAAIFDKAGVINSNAYIYALLNYIGVSITLFILAYIKAKKYLNQLLIHAKSFIILGIVIAAYTLLYFVALQSGFAAYASAIKGSYIIFTILFGLLVLKEKEGTQNLLAGFIIFLGLALLNIFA